MSVNGPIAFWGTGRSSVTYYLQSLDKENPMISISIIRLRPDDQTKKLVICSTNLILKIV